MNEMMQQCCGSNGKPDFVMMKQFMEHCGKEEFSEQQIAMMRQFCGPDSKPDAKQMKQFMENCGCCVP